MKKNEKKEKKEKTEPYMYPLFPPKLMWVADATMPDMLNFRPSLREEEIVGIVGCAVDEAANNPEMRKRNVFLKQFDDMAEEAERKRQKDMEEQRKKNNKAKKFRESQRVEPVSNTCNCRRTPNVRNSRTAKKEREE